MKMISERLSAQLNLPASCTHIKGHGGLKQSVCQIQTQLKGYQFVCKTDVKHFYESIDQVLIMEQINQQVACPTMRYYLWQIIRRTVEYGGLYREITQGISRGCPLGPVLGALYIKEPASPSSSDIYPCKNVYPCCDGYTVDDQPNIDISDAVELTSAEFVIPDVVPVMFTASG